MSTLNQTSINSTTLATTVASPPPFKWSTMLNGSIYILGTLFNLICILVFIHPKLKDSTYRFMLANSVAEFCYTLICAFIMYMYCGPMCSQNTTSLAAQIYFVWFIEYFTSCLAIYCILIEIYISIKRYLLIINKRILERLSNGLVILVLGVISLIYYAPILFIYKIESYQVVVNNQTQTYYTTMSSYFGQTEIGKLIPTILSSVRAILVTIVLLIINIVSSLAFKRHMEKKASMSVSSKSRPSRLSRSRVESS